MSKAPNLLFILSDEHTRDICGCYGHRQIQTPNIDSLAAAGTVFENAYTPCPICIPARASLNTGRYVHEIGYWDNGLPYDGTTRGWNHELRERGHLVDSIGKLHFQGQGTDHGFTEEIDPLHVVDGIGDVLSCLRDDPPHRHKRGGILEAGPGHSTYIDYDVSNADRACEWLAAHKDEDTPWALFVGFVLPHPPYLAPPEDFSVYPTDTIDLLPQTTPAEWPDHPTIDYFRRFFDYHDPFDEATIRRLNSAYYGMVTFLDRQIGRVLRALQSLGLADNTRIIYTSDHGEHLGSRGLFGKFTMYEESAAVPLVMTGPDIPKGKRVITPASLVDMYPTILESFGISPSSEAGPTGNPSGTSLFDFIATESPYRAVLSEYHAVGSRRGYYMVRRGHLKYVYYVDAPPQLFDLRRDPREETDRADDPLYAPDLAAMDRLLRQFLCPEAVDAQAREDQRQRVEEFGGREALTQKGAFDNSPVPGEEPKFHL